MITTTFSMNDASLVKLRDASQLLGLTMSFLVRRLLKNIDRRGTKSFRMFSRVSYQQSGKDTQWNVFHLRLSPQLYEKCLDARKLFKCSVSFLLAAEIEENLDKIVRDIIRGNSVDNYTDNYSRNYMIFYQKGKNGYDYQVYNGERGRLPSGVAQANL